MRPEEIHTKLIKFLILPLIFAGIGFAQDTGEKVYRAVVDPDGIQKVKVLAGDYFFDPNYIIVKVNLPVELTINKQPGIAPHDIVIKAPEAGLDIKEDIGKEPRVIKFTPTKTGKYPMHCSKKFLFFKSHRERGMEGILEVTE
jgi:plastocyanin